MKKKNLGRIAAASLAAMTAVSALSVTASAMVGNNGIASGSVYQVTITETGSNGVTSTTTKYFSSSELADIAISGLGQGADAKKSETTVNAAFGNGTVIYVAANGEITKTNTSGQKYTTSGSSSSNTPNYGSSYNYASSTNNVYLGANGKWYPNLSSLYSSGTSLSTSKRVDGLTYGEVKNSTPGGIVYFDRDSGTYSSVPTGDYVQILGYSSNYDDYYYNHSDWATYDIYYVNGVYYPTLSSALSAAGNDYSKIRRHSDTGYTRPKTNYFSQTTGMYYTTYADALRATGNNASRVYSFNYYANDYYYGDMYGYGYGDPYYYYWLNNQKNKDDDTTSSKNDSTTASIGNRKGWTAVAKYLGSLKNGSSVSVSMNYETSIPSSVTSAIYGKNITVKFVLKNGVVFAINGKNLSTTASIDIDTTYNTNMVPTKLVKAAYKKNDAVSNAQITISGGSFGVEADVTVKFSTKRAGCTAKLYRYNSAKETLSLVDTAKVQSNGKCTFGDVDKGGNFVIILC